MIYKLHVVFFPYFLLRFWTFLCMKYLPKKSPKISHTKTPTRQRERFFSFSAPRVQHGDGVDLWQKELQLAIFFSPPHYRLLHFRVFRSKGVQKHQGALMQKKKPSRQLIFFPSFFFGRGGSIYFIVFFSA
jgi:hypothetical protein